MCYHRTQKLRCSLFSYKLIFNIVPVILTNRIKQYEANTPQSRKSEEGFRDTFVFCRRGDQNPCGNRYNHRTILVLNDEEVTKKKENTEHLEADKT